MAPDLRKEKNRVDLESLAASLHHVAEGCEIEYAPINVSKQGLAIFTRRSLGVNERLVLSLFKKDIELVVRWCKPKPEDPAFYRCGLELVSKTESLDKLILDELNY